MIDDCNECGEELCYECSVCWSCSGGCDCETYGYMDEED